MSSDKKKLRVLVLTEDKLTERFVRRLLETLGFNPRQLRFYHSPSGKGAAEAWVLKQYPSKVRAIRSKSFQKALRLIVARDGDRFGWRARKSHFDGELRNSGLATRDAQEPITLWVPTWSIETWVLALLGLEGIEETEKTKTKFREGFSDVRDALRQATEAWTSEKGNHLNSLVDGRVELKRIA